MIHHVPWKLNIEVHDLMLSPLDFGLDLFPSLLSMSQFFPFGMWVFILCYYMLEGYNLRFQFCRDSQLKVSLCLRDFRLGIGTIENFGILGD
jgi:hypothetical protein